MSAWYALLSHLPFEWAHYSFMANALLAVCIVSPLLAFLGCMVVNKQMAFFSDAIGHAGLTGVAIGMLLGMAQPLWAMLGFAVALAFGVTAMRRYSAASTDTVIGIGMSATVALGIVLLSRAGGFAKYTRFLIGDMLSITPAEIGGLFAVALVFLVVWTALFNSIFMASLNHSLARSRRVNIWLSEAVFSAIIAIVVTVTIPWIGILVINALLILPAATARNVARSTRSYLWAAAAVSTASGITGLVGSYYWNTATGATVVLVAMGLFILSLLVKRFGRR